MCKPLSLRRNTQNMTNIEFTRADKQAIEAILAKWKWVRREWLHLENGFTLIASNSDEVVGFIAVRWLTLPDPLKDVWEGFIDIIEVDSSYRRQGIATRLIQMSETECRINSACQLRAWSSDDKKEAIPMWHSLDFGLYPATDYPKGQAVKGYFVGKRV